MKRIMVTLACLAGLSVNVGMAMEVYVGTYTTADKAADPGQGVAAFSLSDDGAVSQPQWVAQVTPETGNPAYLALDGNVLYSANELETGTATAYAIDPQTHQLTKLNTKKLGFASPVFVVKDPQHPQLVFANFGASDGGKAGVRLVKLLADHRLGEKGQALTSDNPASRLHGVALKTIDGVEYLFTADYGANQLSVYRWDASQQHFVVVTQVTPDHMTNPRHVVVSASGKYVYVVNETDSAFPTQGSIAIYRFVPDDKKLERVTTVAADRYAVEQNYPSAMVFSKDGKYAYVANRHTNPNGSAEGNTEGDIAQFKVIDGGAKLTLVNTYPVGPETGVDYPRECALTPNGRFLLSANQKGNSVTVFAVNQTSGVLTRIHRLHIPSAVALAIQK